MKKKEIVHANVQAFEKWLKAADFKNDEGAGIFVMFGGRKVMVGAIVMGGFVKC